jgi:hypothetical protein
MELGLQGVRSQPVLFGRGARSAVHRDGRPAAADSLRASFGPGGRRARAVSAARPLVAGPRAQADAGRQAVGCFSSRAGKKRFCTVCFVNCFDIFRSIYV